MEKQIIVRGDIFIIPNRASKFEWDLPLNAHNQKCQFLGLEEAKEDDVMVQVWITSDESENWSDHGIILPGFEYSEKEKFQESLWPYCLKAETLKGVKEGDEITLELKNGVKVILTAKQLGYRYQRFGTFEEVYSYVL